MSDVRAFVNPHGVLHEVITVRRVRSVDVEGPPTTDFTWYPGYAWEIAYCARCRTHVGWCFTATESADPAQFWALRCAAVSEESG